MKLTKKQLNDLETIKFFIPSQLKKIKISNSDIVAFFDFSERGISPKKETEGFNLLKQGKNWRGIHMEMYEEGVLDGSMPYCVILEDMPRVVVDFIKREMFKGKDAEIIEKAYQIVNHGAKTL